MARVRSIEVIKKGGSVHPTEVDCQVRVVEDRGGTLLQISSFGSDLRQREKKVSQTLQLGRDEALQLACLIAATFGADATNTSS